MIETAEQSEARRAKIAAAWPIPECGNIAKYKGAAYRQKCRCDKCRAAWSAYNRDRAKRKAARS